MRATLLPYGRHEIDDDDVAAVARALRSDWLTGGPRVAEFEMALARVAGAEHAVAVSSGTAALHAAMFAIGVGPGDEVIVPPITFAATANAVVYQGGTPVFADVDADTLLIDRPRAAARSRRAPRAIVAVDYAGQPCDYDRLRRVWRSHWRRSSIRGLSDRVDRRRRATPWARATERGRSAGSLRTSARSASTR